MIVLSISLVEFLGSFCSKAREAQLSSVSPPTGHAHRPLHIHIHIQLHISPSLHRISAQPIRITQIRYEFAWYISLAYLYYTYIYVCVYMYIYIYTYMWTKTNHTPLSPVGVRPGSVLLRLWRKDPGVFNPPFSILNLPSARKSGLLISVLFLNFLLPSFRLSFLSLIGLSSISPIYLLFSLFAYFWISFGLYFCINFEWVFDLFFFNF